MSSSSDDEMPQLSTHALAALQEFYAEQTIHQDTAKKEMVTVMPEEDWQLSQFWYSEESSNILSREALYHAGEDGRIVCVSCPTLYIKLKELKPSKVSLSILEFDERFQRFGEDFTFYDYKQPLKLPQSMEHAYDIVIADPPFLSEECLTKTASTVQFLAKEKILLCTGAIMEHHAKQLLDVDPCNYKPQHKNNLGNEFYCYTNFPVKYLNETSS